jgi:hypothetical protein
VVEVSAAGAAAAVVRLQALASVVDLAMLRNVLVGVRMMDSAMPRRSPTAVPMRDSIAHDKPVQTYVVQTTIYEIIPDCLEHCTRTLTIFAADTRLHWP